MTSSAKISARITVLISLFCAIFASPAASAAPAASHTFTFDAPRAYDVGYGNGSKVLCDLNGDKIPDLISIPWRTTTFTILRGRGDGTFDILESPADPISSAADMAAADLNNDGRSDIIFTPSTTNQLFICLTTPDGLPGPIAARRIDLPGLANANTITSADFDLDHKNDLVITYSDTNLLTLLRAQSDGSFEILRHWPIAWDVIRIKSADFNGDTFPDIMTFSASGNITVYLGNGDGTFRPPSSYFGSSPYPVEIGDLGYGGQAVALNLNNDQRLDWLFLGQTNDTAFLVGASGALTEASRFFSGNWLYAATADFNRDGLSDLALYNYFAGHICIQLNQGNGVFQSVLSVPASTSHPAVADFNSDGFPDIITDGGLLFQSIDGASFAEPTRAYPAETPYGRLYASGDFNEDGKPDLLLDHVTRVFDVYPNLGDGAFGPPVSLGLPERGSPNFKVADVNQDGHADVIMAVPEIYVVLGNGDLTFRPPRTNFANVFLDGFDLADFDQDGNLDIIGSAVYLSWRIPTLLLGNGDGTFHQISTPPTSTVCAAVASGDFNEDGKMDFAMIQAPSDFGPAYYSVLLGNGDGTFRPGPPIRFRKGIFSSLQEWDMHAGDFNNDGHLDFALLEKYSSLLELYPGHGDGTFGAADGFATQYGSYYKMQVVDFNKDSKLDFIIHSYPATPILLNRTTPPGALTATLDSTTLQLSWPTNGAYTLQTSDRLILPNWQPVTTPPTQTNNTWHLTLPRTEPQKYFRLMPTQ